MCPLEFTVMTNVLSPGTYHNSMYLFDKYLCKKKETHAFSLIVIETI